MKRGVYIRLLVPRRERDGTIAYRAEMRFIRLPIKREDRLQLKERIVG